MSIRGGVVDQIEIHLIVWGGNGCSGSMVAPSKDRRRWLERRSRDPELGQFFQPRAFPHEMITVATR